MSLDHSDQISSLSSSAIYHFRVTSRDSAGLETVSVDHTFFVFGMGGVSISKRVNLSQANSGATLIYTITYVNSSQISNNVKIQDPIPANTGYVPGSAKLNNVSKTDAADSDEFTLVGGVPTWNLGNLAANAYGSVVFQVRVN
jgi:uncharacterized repeat protein (TIGR01451 family)